MPETLETSAPSGWTLPRDIFIAPQRAFDTIAAKPSWLPAYAIVFLAGVLGTILVAPAIAHLNAVLPMDGGAPKRTAAQLADANRTLLIFVALEQAVIGPLVMIGVTATTLTVIARFRGLATTYSTYVALAANCLLPFALGTLVSALGVRFRDPASFADIRSLAIAVPDNLALFAHTANDREVRFLGQFDVFTVWSYVLLAYGITRFTPLRLTAALILAFALEFCFALIV